MKKKKKIIAITLSVVLGVVALISAIPFIYLGVNKIVGTEAAKILLARENMNNGEDTFDWENMFKAKQAPAQSIAPVNTSTSVNKTHEIPMSYFAPKQGESLGTLIHDSPAGKVYKNNGEYNFQNISGASYQGLVVETRLVDIDFRVENAAKNIHFLKNDLNIVNKWVKTGYSKFYLDVTSNKETLIEYYEDDIGQKSLWVVERETREDANSVYSLMFTDMENGALNNPVFLVYIPNERYEYYYGHDGNSTDYLIAEQDKGYWNVFMPNENDYQNVTISDDFAFHSSGNYIGENDDFGVISTVNLKEDIISHNSNGISIHLSAFDGISGIFAPEEITVEQTYDGDTKSYIDIDYLQTDKLKVGLNNGKFLANGSEFTYDNGTVKLNNMNLQFFTNPGLSPQYDVALSLEMGEGLSLKEKLNLFETFLTDNGLTCKYNLADIEKNIIKNSEIANSLTSFYTWNGYLINSSENFKNAEKVIFEKIDTLFAEYESVKDAEEVSGVFSARVSRNQTFAKIKNLAINSAQYNEGKLQIDTVSITVGRSDLLEENKNYKLQIGLARIDKDGKFLSQNTINLKTTDSIIGQTYVGQDLTLTASGVYDIPTALEESQYVVVVYAVTEDEQIRVSEMLSVGFVDTVNETIETSITKININTVDNNLIVEYATKLYFNIAISGETTYISLRRKMMAEVLKYGYPMDNEEITDSSGNSITDGNIASGEYKLKFVISTIDGTVTGYVVCTVTA